MFQFSMSITLFMPPAPQLFGFRAAGIGDMADLIKKLKMGNTTTTTA